MINGQIRDKEVRLISDTGEQIGIVSARDAQKMADEKNLDLVKISPQAKPPVCKIMNYSKYKFDLAKKEKEARKKQKVVAVKEVRLSPNIDTHDDVAIDIMKDFADQVSEYGVVEKQPKMEARTMAMFVGPKA